MTSARPWMYPRPTGLQRRLRRQAILLMSGFLRWLLRSHAMMRLARRLPPFIPFGGLWITRRADVDDLLDRDRDFGMPYLPRMEELDLPFILGLNPSRDYHRQRRALASAFEGIELDRLRDATHREAEATLDATRSGEIDLIRALADRVVAHTAAAELCQGHALTGAQVKRLRQVARDIFINPLGDWDVRDAAEEAAPALREHVTAIVEARRGAAAAGGGPGGDVLDRLLHPRFGSAALEGDELVEDLLGVLVAWVTTVSRAMGFAFEELLRPQRSRELAMAKAAAERGDSDTVGKILFEALRFRPAMPALERVCTRETRIGRRTIRRGQKLMLVLTSAMMDVPDAELFLLDRDDAHRLHFGGRTHHCLGEEIARAQMEVIAMAVLSRGEIRQVSGLKLDGPYPRSLHVAFG